MKRLSIFLPCLLAASLSTASAAPIISELVASNATGLQDENGAYPDWIELYNPGDTPLDLEGYFLTDDPQEDPEQWAFPAVSMPPQSFLLIHASGDDRRDPDQPLHTNFRLDASGETLALRSPQGETLVTFPPLDTDHTYAKADLTPESPFYISHQPTPGEPNVIATVVFSQPGQAFTDTLQLELTAPGGQAIRYTTNGEKPSLFNGKNYSGPITLTDTTMLVASAGGGPFATQVYIKIDPALAERTSDIPLVIADASANLSQTALKDMAFAIIEPEEANAGRARLLSTFHLGTRGGIRTRGETSNSFPKKPLRLEFWDPDGQDRDLAPLDMPAESDWILNARYSFDRTLMHNAWIYELSNQLGQWAPRTRFVELYLNQNDQPVSEADYQGIYTFMETIKRGNNRVDIDRMPADVTEEPEVTGGYLFKKDKTDPGTWNFNGGSEGLQMVEPPEEERDQRGAQAAWLSGYLDEMRDAIRDHGADPEQGYPAYIDPIAWMDHHHLNFLPNNVDALRLSAYFYKPQGERLIAGPVWDFDRSAGGPSDGRIADPLQWGDGGGGTAFFVRGNHGTPVWWEDLFKTPDFLQAWVDRWHALRSQEMVTPTWDPDAEPLPAFSDANISRIIDHLAADISEAQERNFARWPGAPPRPASQLQYSEVGGFPGEIEHIKGWLHARAEWIEESLITVPSFSPNDPVQEAPLTLRINSGGTLFKPAVVYYTTDGSDPRAPGGQPAAGAVLLDGDLTLTTSTRVRARRLDEDYQADRWGPDLRWSGPADQYDFIDSVPLDAANVVISEIHYHPGAPSPDEIAADFDDQDDFEFIELFNISEDRVDLTDARLRGSADFDFADGTVLEPGQRLVLASNAEAFALRYGASVAVQGQFRGQLGNQDGVIRLRNHQGDIVREFTYLDEEPWPTEPDGNGVSLVLSNPSSNPDPGDPAQWIAGSQENGTPGKDETSDPGNGGAAQAFAAWLAGHFTSEERDNPEISGPQADPDGDSLPTLAEFLFGTDPRNPDVGGQPEVSFHQGQLQLRYPSSAHTQHLSVTAEGSADLQAWQTLTATTSTGNGQVTLRVTEADHPPFLRLRLALKPE